MVSAVSGVGIRRTLPAAGERDASTPVGRRDRKVCWQPLRVGRSESLQNLRHLAIESRHIDNDCLPDDLVVDMLVTVGDQISHPLEGPQPQFGEIRHENIGQLAAQQARIATGRPPPAPAGWTDHSPPKYIACYINASARSRRAGQAAGPPNAARTVAVTASIDTCAPGSACSANPSCEPSE